jgi:hypothetical protein
MIGLADGAHKQIMPHSRREVSRSHRSAARPLWLSWWMDSRPLSKQRFRLAAGYEATGPRNRTSEFSPKLQNARLSATV